MTGSTGGDDQAASRPRKPPGLPAWRRHLPRLRLDDEPSGLKYLEGTSIQLKCERCGARLPVSAFCLDSYSRTGISAACLSCHRDRISIDSRVFRLQRQARSLLRRVGEDDWTEWVYRFRHAANVLEGMHRSPEGEEAVFERHIRAHVLLFMREKGLL